MIELTLVRSPPMGRRKFKKIVERPQKSPNPRITLFSEVTFPERFFEKDFSEFLSSINLPENTYAFFGAFVAQEKLEAEKSLFKMLFDEGFDKFAKYEFFNNGVLIGNNYIQRYKKEICTNLDSKMRSQVKGMISGIEYLPCFDASKKQIKFPKLFLDKKELEFRVCADITCGTTNTPDLVLCPAHFLFYPRERSQESLGNTPLIVNDVNKFMPIYYQNRSRHGITAPSAIKSQGIQLSYIHF